MHNTLAGYSRSLVITLAVFKNVLCHFFKLSLVTAVTAFSNNCVLSFNNSFRTLQIRHLFGLHFKARLLQMTPSLL